MDVTLHPDLRRPELVISDDRLSILRAMPVTREPGPPVVVFNSIGKPGTPPEFAASVARLRRPVLFVMDHKATWYSAPETADRVSDAIVNALADWGGTAVDTLGFSMGGYAAIAYAERVPVRNAVALAPRFSPDPAIVADPRGHESLRRLSGKLAFATLAAGLQRLDGGLILHGMRGPDLCQFRHIHAPQRVDHWLLPQCDHHVAIWLRRRGHLPSLLHSALQGERAETARRLAALGALRHRSLRARLMLHPVRLYARLRDMRGSG